MSSKSSRRLKMVIVGDGAVGKTCLLHVYASDDNSFPDDYEPTIFDNYNFDIDVNEKKYSVALWDTAGQEDYDELRSLSYNDVDIYLICFSVVNENSFSNVKNKWIKEIKKHTKKGTKIILCGTKIDLRNNEETLEHLHEMGKKVVTKKMGMKMSKELKCSMYVECSAKKNINVKNVFDTSIQEFLYPRKKKILGCVVM